VLFPSYTFLLQNILVRLETHHKTAKNLNEELLKFVLEPALTNLYIPIIKFRFRLAVHATTAEGLIKILLEIVLD